MNGAAMNCHQDPVLRPQHQDPSSLRNPGYHLQINRQPNIQLQNSKTLNYPSFPSNYQADGSCDHSQQYGETANSYRELQDPRIQRPRAVQSRNKPIDLPVPQFQVDEHSVCDNGNTIDDVIQTSKGLDLDTRIGLLIKSKALVGMHPIFSDLNDSEESESDLDDAFSNKQRSKFHKDRRKNPSIEKEVPIREFFDDPDKPLSRPPSPFLSRATYLFWFNKAIEIKQQAKAQEQALLEKAAKRVIQDTSAVIKLNESNRPQERPLLKNLMNQISKELKEVIKQEFIREVIEQTAFNTLDDWWEKQYKQKKSGGFEGSKIISNKTEGNEPESLVSNLEFQGSTSPKMPFPWGKHSEEEISPNKVLRENCEKYCDSSHSTQRDKCVNLNISVISEHEKHRTEERNCEDLKKKIEMNCHDDRILGKLSCDKTVCEEHKSVHLLKAESSECDSEVSMKKSGMNQLNPPHCVDPSLDDNVEEKLVIVKDILDYVFNRVNKIVLQRNYTTPNQELNGQCK